MPLTKEEWTKSVNEAWSEIIQATFKEKIDAAVQAEREACAKIVETEAMQYAEPTWAFEIVNDIRARGNTCLN